MLRCSSFPVTKTSMQTTADITPASIYPKTLTGIELDLLSTTCFRAERAIRFASESLEYTAGRTFIIVHFITSTITDVVNITYLVD